MGRPRSHSLFPRRARRRGGKEGCDSASVHESAGSQGARRVEEGIDAEQGSRKAQESLPKEEEVREKRVSPAS